MNNVTYFSYLIIAEFSTISPDSYVFFFQMCAYVTFKVLNIIYDVLLLNVVACNFKPCAFM